MTVFSVCPAILYSWLFVIFRREQKLALLRRDEVVEISPVGIVFRGEQKFSALWSQVRSINQDFTRESLHFVTDKGTFEVHRSLMSFLAFSRILEKLAPELTSGWEDDEELEKEAAVWSSGKIGEGAQIFHYRHRLSRLFLVGMALIVVTPLLLFFIMPTVSIPEDNSPKMSIASLLVILEIGMVVWIYCCLLYYKSSIWADETGLEIHSVFGTKRFLWEEIRSYGFDQNGYFIETSGRKRRFANGIAPIRIHVLERLITTRSVHATGSWERLATAKRQEKTL